MHYYEHRLYSNKWMWMKLTSCICFYTIKIKIIKKIGVETIFTVKLLVNFTNNYKELTRNTLNAKLSRKTEIACSCTPIIFSFINNLEKKKNIYIILIYFYNLFKDQLRSFWMLLCCAQFITSILLWYTENESPLSCDWSWNQSRRSSAWETLTVEH